MQVSPRGIRSLRAGTWQAMDFSSSIDVEICYCQDVIGAAWHHALRKWCGAQLHSQHLHAISWQWEALRWRCAVDLKKAVGLDARDAKVEAVIL
mmetsp:Transcript_14341/g.31399  ORF Transcript_14341/g.31399 Transcript_14341/m.31399 type:complete len:94 (-) Transcript_14341:39-320(-)